MRILQLLCCTTALLVCVGPAEAARGPKPIVITLDGHDYVTYTTPVVLSPAEHLALAPEARMSDCHRSNGLPMVFGPHKLVLSMQGASVDVATMRIDFDPTRVVVNTLFQDVICEGEANGGETGVGRMFRDDFEVE